MRNAKHDTRNTRRARLDCIRAGMRRMGKQGARGVVTTLDLNEMIKRACAAFDALSPSEKLRHRYMQRRSFARGMGSDTTPHEVHCAEVDKRMPHETTLTDTQIGLILIGEPWE